MATEHRYVNPDADVGGDGTTSATSSGGGTHAYQSLATWNSSETVGNNIDHYVYCERGSTTPRDTSQCTVNLTIGNNSLVYILPNDTTYDPDTGADATSYHYGVYDAGFVIYTQTNYVNTLHIIANKVSVQGIEVRSEPPSVKSGQTLYIAQTTAYTHRDIIARGGGTYGVGQVVHLYKGIVLNTIADGYGVSTTAFEQTNFAGGDCWNCVGANCSEGFQSQASGGVDPILVNCLAYNNTTDYIDDGGGWNASCATCATTDGTAAESWVTVTSVSTSDGTDLTAPSTKDWSAVSSGALDDAGTDTGAPTVDIALETRVSTFDIGAFEVVSGGGITLVLADSTHAQAADNVALVQANTLAMAGADSTQASDNLVLVQANTLALADADSTQASDNLVLVQSNTLALADSDHTQAADNLDLVLAGLLGMQDADHAQAADNVALIQANTLTTAAADHAQAADNIALELAGSLGVQDATSAQAVDNIGLVQANTLALADADSSQSADGIDLQQANTLALADALHAHAADNLSLDTALFLSVSDAAHAQLADNLALIQANVLSVVDSAHAQLADQIDLIPAVTLIVSDALHAMLSDNINISGFGDVDAPARRTFAIAAEDRIVLVVTEDRIFNIQ